MCMHVCIFAFICLCLHISLCNYNDDDDDIIYSALTFTWIDQPVCKTTL